MRNGIIIPCYNEADRLPAAEFKTFAIAHSEYLLCFVNDGSSDDTVAVLQAIQTAAPGNVLIVDLKENSGKANAVSQGAKHLYQNTSVDNIGFLDADLATDFNDYKTLVDELKNSKVVIGSRRGGDDEGVSRSLLRQVFSHTIKVMIQFITRLPIADTQCGAKVFSREFIPTIFKTPFTSKWLFDVEIFLRLKEDLGKKSLLSVFTEKPLQRWEEVEGSKLNLKDSLMIPYNLISIWVQYVIAGNLKRPTLGIN